MQSALPSKKDGQLDSRIAPVLEDITFSLRKYCFYSKFKAVSILKPYFETIIVRIETEDGERQLRSLPKHSQLLMKAHFSKILMTEIRIRKQ